MINELINASVPRLVGIATAAVAIFCPGFLNIWLFRPQFFEAGVALTVLASLAISAPVFIINCMIFVVATDDEDAPSHKSEDTREHNFALYLAAGGFQTLVILCAAPLLAVVTQWHINTQFACLIALCLQGLFVWASHSVRRDRDKERTREAPQNVS
jgi:membrane protein implicated in regulation of membrane protease activity